MGKQLSFIEPNKTFLECLGDQTPSNRIREESGNSYAILDLLAVCIGGRQQIEKAKNVLENFSDISYLKNCAIRELMQTPGITEAIAIRLKAAISLGTLVSDSSQKKHGIISSPKDIYDLMRSRSNGEVQEHLWVIILDTRNNVIDVVDLYKGSTNSAMIRISEIFTAVIKRNGVAIVLVHNHPSGDPCPSPEDISLTRSVAQAGKLMEIQVLDHVVMGEKSYRSLKESGLAFS